MFSALHPALVHFPIALITFSVICELIGRFKQSPFARTVAWWTMVAALIGGAFTVAAGYYDMWHANLQEATHALVHQHLAIGWVLVVSVILLTLWRWRVRLNPMRHVGWGYLTSSLLVLCLTFLQGWYGGEMAYAFGAGVPAAGQGQMPPQEAQANLERVKDTLDQVPGLGAHAEEGHGEHEHH